MCCACSSGQKNLVCRDYCKVFHSSFCQELEIEKLSSAFDREVITGYCRPFLEQHAKCSVLGSSSPSAPHHSPMPPQSSLTSSFSSSGVFAGDMISQIRENGNGAVYTSQERLKDSTIHAEELLSIDLLKNIDKKSFHDNDRLDGIGKETSLDDTSGSIILERHEDSNDDKIGHLNSTLEDVRSLIDGDESDGPENSIRTCNAASFLSTTETDPLLWKPPGPADIEDDMNSVAIYYDDDDDDDEYNDGTKWGRSSCLGGFDEEHGSSIKVERQKVMMEAMNGQFKILVSRFLASEDISFCEGGHGEKWLDTVASLSWDAALLIKPEANEGRAMDPGSYVKVKCVASGARSQSEVIKGLVFKKNTAHKHMPTKCKNPRLLLLQGVLGHREVGLSSFNAMKEDDNYLKSIHETIKTCNPNVVLVEKSVSRDMQEFLVEQGMTLVFDMKLTRLNRIARCIGLPIISCADILSGLKVKQCEMFHVEKFVEEHNSLSEGGKRSSKTLMFLEGFPKPLGCTILLKGAPIVELKKVKRVLQYTVFAAYHLILETSFFADQRALFPAMNAEENGSLKDKVVSANACGEAPDVDNSCTNGNPLDIAQEYTSQVPSSNGSLENSIHEDMFSGSNFKSNGSLQSPRFSPDIGSNENNHGDLVIDKLNSNTVIQPDSLPELPWQFMSSFSSSLKKFLSDSFTPVNTESISSYFGFEEELDSQGVDAFSVSPSLDAHDHEAEVTSGFIQEKPHDEISDIEKVEPLSSLSETIEQNTTDLNSKSEMQNKDDIENVLDPQSILVLMSSQCLEKGVACEQSHLSRIKYYGNFDVSLGRFLRDTLLSKKHRCSSCGEPPEAHVYCYTHQNGNLTVFVKKLDSSLSGEQEGKIWMWTRCLKCEHENGVATSTERVVMSTAARGLSFGKFLELSFSSHSVASRLSSKCGHSLHRDCLRFFGLGSKVAMFRYSSVEIYAACKPPPVMEFNNQNGQDWVKREAKSVLRKGDLLFLEIANFLQKLKRGDFGLFQKQSGNFSGSVKDLCEVEKMLIQEKSEFGASLLKAINFSGQRGKPVSEILSLSWLNQELLLELYIWDRRLHSLLECTKDNDESHDEVQDQYIKDSGVQGDKYVERTPESYDMDLESSVENPTKTVETSSSHSFHAQNLDSLESELKMESADISENNRNSQVTDLPSAIENGLPGQASFVQDQEDSVSSPKNMQVDHSSPAIVEQYSPTEVVAESGLKTDNMSSGGENSAVSMFQEQHTTNSLYEDSSDSKSKDPDEWIWSSAAELQRNYRMDLRGGSLQKFEYIHSYTPKYLSPIQLVAQERELLHFPLGADGGVISVCEDDISSMIACALARSEHQHSVIENIDEKDALEGKGEAEKVFDNSWSLTSDGSVATSFWSSTGSAESEGMHPSRSLSSLSSDESSTSGSESSFFMDRSIASENLHPEISFGGRKAFARNKYSVVLVHAKQFYSLRRMCCPSELAYISSLSRSKRWDAQGGKSKAFFAKTFNDRFIIKQVKKTEIDSFMKFAPEYFRHIAYSISSGSQTCLAKILGIYQVRQSRGGKEVKTDLIVMENLLFGRNFTRTYDLKGAVFSRYVSDPNEPKKVLLDENFVEDMRISPMYIAGRNKHLFQRAIWNDTSFLTSINVMDYSLLVGVDKQGRELVFGIIDYLRQYTWDKQLETWVKSSLVVPKNSLPTVISPKEYKKRFRKFMSKYFLTVPDTWRTEQCSGPCKFCNDGNSSSAENCQNGQAAAISNT